MFAASVACGANRPDEGAAGLNAERFLISGPVVKIFVALSRWWRWFRYAQAAPD